MLLKIRPIENKCISYSRIRDAETLVKSSCPAVLAMLIATAPVWAQTLDKGMPANGSNIPLNPTSSGYEARVIVSADAEFTDFKVSSSDAVLAAALDSTPDRTQGGKVKLVTIRIKKGAVRQGPYPLTLVGTGKDRASVEREVVVTVPAVTLDPPETLVVVRERWFGDTTSNSPQLWETSQRSWVTGIALAQKGDSDAGGEPAGRIVPTNKIADISPGHNTRIELDKHFQLVGDFPLGTTKGKLAFQADQLANPVTFGFEVRSRIPRPWLFLPLVGGLFLGWMTRYWLQRRLAVNEERQKPFALIDIIDTALRRNKDAEFQSDAQAAMTEAVAAANMEKIEDIRNGATSAQAAFQKAIDDLHKRRADLDQAIAKMLALARVGWRAPAQLISVLAVTREALEKRSPELEANNVALASAALDNARQALGKEVSAAIKALLEALDEFGAVVDTAVPILGDEPAAALNSVAKTNAATLTDARDLLDRDPNSSVETLQSSIEKVHAGVIQLGYLVANAKTAFDRQIAKLDTTLGPAKLPNPALWHGWLAQARGFAKELDKVAAAPERGLGSLKEQAVFLLKRLQEALIAQVPEKDVTSVEALLQEGKYAEVIAKIRQAITVSSAVGVERSAGAPSTSARLDFRPSGTTEPNVFTFSSIVTPSLSFGFSAPPSGTIGIALLAGQSRRTVEVTSTLLSVIYGLLIAAGGYFLFADKWIGMPLDFATVFFWAFATDVGVEAATSAARSLKKS